MSSQIVTGLLTGCNIDRNSIPRQVTIHIKMKII
jgi:hypothetical protein